MHQYHPPRLFNIDGVAIKGNGKHAPEAALYPAALPTLTNFHSAAMSASNQTDSLNSTTEDDLK